MRLCFLLFAIATSMAVETNVEDTFNEGNEQFTSKMFTEVVNKNPGKSVVLSAFSVLQPLAQLALASVGESHDELLKAIGLPSDNVTKEIFPVVNGQLRAIKGVELKIANKIYIPHGLELNPDFEAVSKDVFDSEVENVDFVKNLETAKEINTWVEDHTNHRIKDLVDPSSLNGDTRAVLVNAIYFKGSWKKKFNPKFTTPRDFHISQDKTIQVPTMYRSGDYKYFESKELDAQLLELPYEGDESSLLVVLPKTIEGLNELLEKLKDTSVLSKAIQKLSTQTVDVSLPKFKIETKTNLKEVLSEIGVKKLFEPSSARLERLLRGVDGGLYVSEAIQKAFIEVNEEGAEAAAANEFDIAYLSAGPIPIYFDANHPFVFFLKEKNNVLFSGVYQT